MQFGGNGEVDDVGKVIGLSWLWKKIRAMSHTRLKHM